MTTLEHMGCAPHQATAVLRKLLLAFVVVSTLITASVQPARAAGSGIFVAGPFISGSFTSGTFMGRKDKSAPATVRWSEDQPGCTFSTTQDGKYQYGLWSEDIGIILSVDAREVQIIRHRIEPIFGVLLTIRYRGSAGADVAPGEISLQFMKHFKVVRTSVDPDDYTEKIQADADALDDETRREVARHPEQKQAREARLQDYQKSVSELIEFLGKNSLRAGRLDRGDPELSGWVFFNTDSKWLGGWKAQEEFVLRVPLAGKVFEFPFKLPPKAGELLLRKRE